MQGTSVLPLGRKRELNSLKINYYIELESWNSTKQKNTKGVLLGMPAENSLLFFILRDFKNNGDFLSTSVLDLKTCAIFLKKKITSSGTLVLGINIGTWIILVIICCLSPRTICQNKENR